MNFSSYRKHLKEIALFLSIDTSLEEENLQPIPINAASEGLHKSPINREHSTHGQDC